jgi:hypothetical protein
VKPEAGIEEFALRSRLQNSTLTDNAFRNLYENYAQGIILLLTEVILPMSTTEL